MVAAIELALGIPAPGRRQKRHSLWRGIMDNHAYRDRPKQGLAMRAMVLTAVGGPDVLQLAELPEPAIRGEHEVLVRLRAASINPADYKQRFPRSWGRMEPGS
jgi:hypothetical protein